MADLHPDWRAFLSLLIRHRVKFVLVGGHAVAVHARPRMTEDLDVFVEPSVPNAERLRAALVEFGFGEAAPSVRTLAVPDKVFMLGMLPYRIDVLTGISGVSFRRAWTTRVRLQLDFGTVPFISRSLLIENKRAARRPKDVADLEELGVPARRARGRQTKRR